MTGKSPARSSEFDIPTCECGLVAQLVTGKEVYPHRQDLAGKKFWRCPNAGCDAWVGCHPQTTRPLGRLANLKLRQAKIAAHAWFDRRWNEVPNKAVRAVARRREYAWLAAQLRIPSAECHIGMFDLGTCLRVVEVCRVAAGAPSDG